MEDDILRKYGLSDPFADLWEDADSANLVLTTSSNEADALGTGQAVSSMLTDRSLYKNDSTIPAEYSLNSRSFNARNYIREVHRKATQADLRRGQEYLKSAIDMKSGSLKVLVEENFDRFVGSKRVIDSVSAQIANEFGKRDGTDARVDNIRDSLNDSSARAAQIFEPVIENRRKSDRLRATIGILEQYQAHFDLPSILLKCIERNDNEALLREYKRGQHIFKDVRKSTGTMNMSTSERRNARVLMRVWSEVERIMRNHELTVWRALENQKRVDNDSTAKLANLLLELGVDSNPYFRAFINHSSKIQQVASANLEIARTQVEILRRRLSLKYGSNTAPQVEAFKDFVASQNSAVESASEIVQSKGVLTFWDSLQYLVQDVWLRQVADVVENWRIVQDMTSPRAAKLLPNGPDGQCRKFHSFSVQERGASTLKAEETIALLCSSITDFFVNKPIVELPSIYSPTSATTPAMPMTPATSASQDTVQLPDLGDQPRAEFSFIPPTANALSASQQLHSILTKLIMGVKDLHDLQVSSKTAESLRVMVTAVRERMIRAVCEIWQADCDLFSNLETWKKSPTGQGTSFPKDLMILQKAILEGLRQLTFIDDKRAGPIPGPSERLINNIRQQFHKNMHQCITRIVALALPTEQASPVDADVKQLLVMTNLATIQQTVLIRLIQLFEHAFSTSLSEDLQKLNQLITSYDNKLFTLYTKQRTAEGEAVIQQGLRDINWRHHPYPSRVRDYAHGLCLSLISWHAQISSTLSPASPLLPRVMATGVTSMVRTLVAELGAVAAFNEGAVMQITLDLEYITHLLGPAMTREAAAALDSLYQRVEAKSTGEAAPGERPDLKKILTRAKKGGECHAKVFQETTTTTTTTMTAKESS